MDWAAVAGAALCAWVAYLCWKILYLPEVGRGLVRPKDAWEAAAVAGLEAMMCTLAVLAAAFLLKGAP